MTPSYNLTVRSENGGTHRARGSCTEAEAFALYMLASWTGAARAHLKPVPGVEEFRRAVITFICAATAYRERVGGIEEDCRE